MSRQEEESNAARVHRLGSGSDELRLSAVGLVEELVRRALYDATSDGQSAAHAGEVRVDLTSAHAALVDAPDDEGLTTTAVTSISNIDDSCNSTGDKNGRSTDAVSFAPKKLRSGSTKRIDSPSAKLPRTRNTMATRPFAPV